jgi:hypothetical protein
MLLSALVAPMLMFTQTRALVEILAGKVGGWATQRRDADKVTGKEAFAAMGWISVTGLVLAVAFWFTPDLLTATAADPGRPDPGRAADHAGRPQDRRPGRQVERPVHDPGRAPPAGHRPRGPGPGLRAARPLVQPPAGPGPGRRTDGGTERRLNA